MSSTTDYADNTDKKVIHKALTTNGHQFLVAGSFRLLN